jgi:ABC-type amino acid transport system permease subunit
MKKHHSSVVSIIFSMILGGIAGTVRYSNIPILSKVVGIIVDIIRNLPLLLIIFIPICGKAKYVKKMISNNGKLRIISTIMPTTFESIGIFVIYHYY